MYSYGPPHMAVQKQDDQLELTYSNYVRTQDVTLKTCRRRWVIGRSGERGSGISVLAARHDDDDDDIYMYIYIYIKFPVRYGPVGWVCRIHWLHLWRGVRLPPVSVLDMTLNNLWSSSNAGALGNVEYSFIAIAPSSSLARRSRCPINGSSRTELFWHLTVCKQKLYLY